MYFNIADPALYRHISVRWFPWNLLISGLLPRPRRCTPLAPWCRILDPLFLPPCAIRRAVATSGREGRESANSRVISLLREKNKRSRGRDAGGQGGGRGGDRYDFRVAPAAREKPGVMTRLCPPRVGENDHIGFVVWEGGFEKWEAAAVPVVAP